MCKTDYGGGGGGGGEKDVPKIDYVICERPLFKDEIYCRTELSSAMIFNYYLSAKKIKQLFQ